MRLLRKAGITPAWAGKSRHTWDTGARPEDHPRVGGEKLIELLLRRTVPGSPPRGRGKDLWYGIGDFFSRITPAWAGKRCHIQAAAPEYWDHPRVGGEKCPLVSLVIFGWGSPPRGRGKGMYQRSCFSCRWDHPRVGGEKSKTQPDCLYPVGSPPRGRGKAPARDSTQSAAGITPAWAGKSL